MGQAIVSWEALSNRNKKADCFERRLQPIMKRLGNLLLLFISIPLAFLLEEY